MRLIDSQGVRAEVAFSPHDAKRLQEWLWLHGFKVEIDGVFGPATRAALAEFRSRHEIDGDEPEETVIDALTLPMRRVLEVRTDDEVSFRDAVVRVAQMHLAAGASEAPGGNRGPWVRLYGLEGQPWCASFVTFLIEQAAELTGTEAPIRGSADCDEMACQGRRTGRFVNGNNRPEISPGDIFLLWRPLPGGHKDYCHTGIVERLESDHLVTIEGNTNPSGGREGFEVERRIRSFDRKDFIRLA